MRAPLSLSLPHSRAAGALVACVLLAGCLPAPPPGIPAPQPPPAVDGPALVVAIPPPPPDAPPPEAEAPPPPAMPSLAGGSWPMFHGDLARTGVVRARPIKSPRMLWHATVGIQGWLNAPVIVGALVVVPSSGDKHNFPDARDGLHALDLRTGRPVWQAHFDADANGVALAGGRAFATSDDGHTYAVALDSGAILWKQKGLGKVYAGPLPIGDQVIVGDAGGLLRAYAQADGAPRWKVQLDGAIRGGAASDGRIIYAASQGGDVVAVTLDGHEMWRRAVTRPGFGGGKPVPIEAYPAPIVDQDHLIVPFARDTGYDTPALVALDTRTGKSRWTAQGIGKIDWGNIRTTPVLVDGLLIYGEPYSGDVAAVDAKSGRTRYRITLGPCFFPQWASPVAAGDLVYLPRFDGSLYAIHAGTGALAWQLYLGDQRHVAPGLPQGHVAGAGCAWEVPSGASLYAPPAIAEDGTVLIGSGEGVLYAIGDAARP
ncbi:MAG: PQQ-binding-like beta-propeller repeat protein [Byssovorax sp.]